MSLERSMLIFSDCELLFLIDDIGGNLNIKKCIYDKAGSLSWLDMRQTILKDWKNDFEMCHLKK